MGESSSPAALVNFSTSSPFRSTRLISRSPGSPDSYTTQSPSWDQLGAVSGRLLLVSRKVSPDSGSTVAISASPSASETKTITLGPPDEQAAISHNKAAIAPKNMGNAAALTSASTPYQLELYPKTQSVNVGTAPRLS